MLRFRQTLIIAAIAAASSIPASYAQAQSGRGRPAGPSGLILGLAQYPVVQEELKLKDPQKTKIRALAESSNQRQSQLRDQMTARTPVSERAQRFAAMREAQMVLDQDVEQALASILDRGQYRRLKQIQLQVEGISALTRPDMIEDLNLHDDQVEEIRELRDQSVQVQRESGRVMFDMMRTAFPKPANNGPNPGGPVAPNFRDPATQEAMRAFMAKPEVRAKMREMHDQNTKIQGDVLAVAVNRVLGRRQAAAYKKMLGAPLDLSQPRGGPGRGPGNRPPGENQSGRANAADRAKASDSDDDEAAMSKAASKSKGTDANAKAKRKTLRQQRGLDD